MQFSGLAPGTRKRYQRIQPDPMTEVEFARLLELLPHERHGQVLLDVVTTFGEGRIAPDYLRPFLEGNACHMYCVV